MWFVSRSGKHTAKSPLLSGVSGCPRVQSVQGNVTQHVSHSGARDTGGIPTVKVWTTATSQSSSTKTLESIPSLSIRHLRGHSRCRSRGDQGRRESMPGRRSSRQGSQEMVDQSGHERAQHLGSWYLLAGTSIQLSLAVFPFTFLP